MTVTGGAFGLRCYIVYLALLLVLWLRCVAVVVSALTLTSPKRRDIQPRCEPRLALARSLAPQDAGAAGGKTRSTAAVRTARFFIRVA